MKIIGIEMVPITARFKNVTETHFGTLGAKEDKVVLKLFTDEGIVGLGEVSGSFPVFYVETQSTITSVIKDYLAPNVLINEDPFNIDKIVDRMDSLVYGYNLTKSAIDCALFDIMGKSLKVPVYKLLGGLYKDKIPLRHVVGFDTPKKMAQEATSAMQAGFKAIKMKGGVDPQRDVEALAEIRDAIGLGIKICIDMNGAYDVKTAMHTINEMRKYAPIEIEQPLRLFDFEGMARLREAVDVPIGVCEMAYTIYEIMRVIQMKTGGFFNFMICRSGGFYRGRQIISMVDAAGLYCVGADPLGFGIQLAANAHFDASTDKLSRPSGYGAGIRGLTGQFDTKNINTDIVLKTPRIENGFLEVPQGPGLGVELNEEVMQQYLTPGKSAVLVGNKFQ